MKYVKFKLKNTGCHCITVNFQVSLIEKVFLHNLFKMLIDSEFQVNGIILVLIHTWARSTNVMSSNSVKISYAIRYKFSSILLNSNCLAGVISRAHAIYDMLIWIHIKIHSTNSIPGGEEI